MRKDIWLLFVMAVATLSLTACGGTLGQGTAQFTRVGIAYDTGGKGDGSFNESAYAGVAKAQQEFSAEIREVVAGTNETDAGRRTLLRQLASDGCNPVIAVGYDYGAALKTVASEFPGTTFAIVDAVVDALNVGSLVFSSEQGAYLIGVIAASASKTGRIGFIGGMQIPLLEAFEAGYIQGARSVNPTIAIESTYLGAAGDTTAWNAPEKARSITVGMIAGGVDVVYASAGASGLGMFQAIQAAGGPANNLWGIGADVDQYNVQSLASVRDVILTSMMKRVDVAVYDAIKGVAAGTPLVGVQNFDLVREGVGYATSNPAVNQYKAAAEAAAARIRSGATKVTTW